MFAYYAHQAGWFVTVYLLGSKDQRSISFRDALLFVQQENIDSGSTLERIDINHDGGGLQAIRTLNSMIEEENNPPASAQAAE